MLTTHRSEFSRAVFRNYASGAGGQRPHLRSGHGGRACPINLSTARTVRPARLLQLFSAPQPSSLVPPSSDVGIRITSWAIFCFVSQAAVGGGCLAVPIQWRRRSQGQQPQGISGRGERHHRSPPLRLPSPRATWRYMRRLTASYGDKSTSLAGGYPSRPSQGGSPVLTMLHDVRRSRSWRGSCAKTSS